MDRAVGCKGAEEVRRDLGIRPRDWGDGRSRLERRMLSSGRLCRGGGAWGGHEFGAPETDLGDTCL